jgi:hypothetical protein
MDRDVWVPWSLRSSLCTPHDAAAIGLVKRISQGIGWRDVEVVFTAVVNFLAILIGQTADSPDDVEERLQTTMGFVRDSIVANEDPQRQSARH